MATDESKGTETRSKKRAFEVEEEVKGGSKAKLSYIELLRQKLKEVPQCTICTEELIEKKAEIEPCRHVFCMECITKWAEIENTCPNCKREFNKIVEKLVLLKATNVSNGPYKKQRSNRGKKSKGINESKTSLDYKSVENKNLEEAEPQSEILKVIDVQKKKQRTDDNYLGIEDVDGLDSDYDDEYGSDYDSDEAEMRIEDLTGLPQNLLRLIVVPMNLEGGDRDDAVVQS